MHVDAIVYEKRFVAFLDVLGFKEIVNGSESLQRIQEYFDALMHTVSTKLSEIDIDVIAISDSVIFSIPIHDESPTQKLALLAKICDAVSDFQCEMALKKIWMRGAISYGDCYVRKDPIQIVGPAFIKAYELEQNVALYPRVIIDPKIIGELGFKTDKELIDAVNGYEVEPGYHYTGGLFNWYESRGGRQIEKDVPLFIDYFNQLFNPKINSDFHKNLNLIVDHLIEHLFGDRWNLSVYSKHQWTRKYLYSLCLVNCPFAYNDLESANAKINERLRNL